MTRPDDDSAHSFDEAMAGRVREHAKACKERGWTAVRAFVQMTETGFDAALSRASVRAVFGCEVTDEEIETYHQEKARLETEVRERRQEEGRRKFYRRRDHLMVPTVSKGDKRTIRFAMICAACGKSNASLKRAWFGSMKERWRVLFAAAVFFPVFMVAASSLDESLGAASGPFWAVGAALMSAVLRGMMPLGVGEHQVQLPVCAHHPPPSAFAGAVLMLVPSMLSCVVCLYLLFNHSHFVLQVAAASAVTAVGGLPMAWMVRRWLERQGGRVFELRSVGFPEGYAEVRGVHPALLEACQPEEPEGEYH